MKTNEDKNGKKKMYEVKKKKERSWSDKKNQYSEKIVKDKAQNKGKKR